ncbi:hypothetical protein J1614_000407 [Plenodomus biglobosus]|nr:hypothetical protein J1614_000407 [Plenodomus biglobosus]
MELMGLMEQSLMDWVWKLNGSLLKYSLGKLKQGMEDSVMNASSGGYDVVNTGLCLTSSCECHLGPFFGLFSTTSQTSDRASF